jgi:ABC-2 type transport system permease protein
MSATIAEQHALTRPERAGRNVAWLFLRVKFRLAFNYLRNFKRHLLVHVVVGVGTLALLLLGGFEMFEFLFRFLQAPAQQPFGVPMMNRLIGMVFLAFFSMLTFSNLIIMLTTTYISREVEFYMAQPVGHRRLFFLKLAESTLYSSWAFLVLSMPFILALGRTAQPAPPLAFYPMALLSYIPFVVLPAALGSIAVLLVTAFVPAKQTFRLAVILAAVALMLIMAFGRQSVGGGWGEGAQREGIARVMRFMGLGDIAWMPSTWLTRAVRAALAGEWREQGFWTALLASCSLMALQVCYWLARPLYFRGYCASRSSTTTGRLRTGGYYLFFDRLTRFLPSSTRALVVKDLTVFWRDPAQWGQLAILFGMLLIYVLNLGGASELSRLQRQLPFWQTLVALFNIGATSFVLSILSTRFIYPMLSLEGKQHWVIGLAPIGRTRLVWVKYLLAWFSSMGITVPLILLSCAVLRTDAFTTAVSLATIIIMSMGLNSLAVGLGALMPNFAEDNPSRIANGLGGTLNVILSLIYIGGSISLLGPLMWNYVHQARADALVSSNLVYGGMLIWTALQLCYIVLPMALGLRHWKQLEF